MDLILLLIEEARKQRDVMKNLIDDVRTIISSLNMSEQTLPFEEKLKVDTTKLEMTIKQTKLRKLERDEDDYK